MTALAERRRGIETRPDGSLWDHATFRLWLDQQDAARPRRAHVERLSRLTDVPASRPAPSIDLADPPLGAIASRDGSTAPTEAPCPGCLIRYPPGLPVPGR